MRYQLYNPNGYAKINSLQADYDIFVLKKQIYCKCKMYLRNASIHLVECSCGKEKCNIYVKYNRNTNMVYGIKNIESDFVVNSFVIDSETAKYVANQILDTYDKDLYQAYIIFFGI